MSVLAAAALALVAGAVVVPPALSPAQAALPTPAPDGTELTSFVIDGDPDGPNDWDDPYTAPGTTPSGYATSGLLPANFYPDFSTPDYPDADAQPVTNPAFEFNGTTPEFCIDPKPDDAWINTQGDAKLGSIRVDFPIISNDGNVILGCDAPNPEKADTVTGYAAFEVVRVPTAGGFQNQFVIYGAWQRGPDETGELNLYIPISDGIDGDLDADGYPVNTVGDRIIGFNYKDAPTLSFSYQIFVWSGTDWVVDQDVPAGSDGITDDFHAAVGPGGDSSFGEFALNLTTADILPDVPEGTCSTVRVADFIFTATGNSTSASLVDYVGTPGFPISNCGELVVEKQSAVPFFGSEDFRFSANQADGLAVFPGDQIADTEPDSTLTLLNDTLTLGTPQTYPNPDTYTVLAQPDYRITEATPTAPWEFVSLECTYSDIYSPILDGGVPTGEFLRVTESYDIADGFTPFAVAPLFDVDGDGSIGDADRAALRTECVIVNTRPPVPYQIIVNPRNATNALGDQHTYTVVLRADTDDDGAIDDPAPGATIELEWTGAGDGIVSVNGVAVDPPVTSTTCTTELAFGVSACVVVVASPADVGSGSLTARFDLPGSDASDPIDTNVTGPIFSPPGSSNIVEFEGVLDLDSIEAVGLKGWAGYRVDVDPDGTNQTGADHTFTITVEKVAPDGTTSTPPDGVLVDYGWSGPAGTTLDPDGQCEIFAGECTVVASSDIPGTGTITVTAVRGNPVALTEEEEVGAEALLITNTPTPDSDLVATKTWIGIDVTITDDATNVAGAPHTFTVTVLADDGTTGAVGVAGAIVAASLTDVVGGATIDDDLSTCDDGTAADGTCTIVVTSDDAGAATVVVDSVDLSAVFPLLTPPVVDLDGTTGFLPGFDGDVSATKTWRQYQITADPDATNLLGDPHTFTFTVEYTEDGETWAALEDSSVTFAAEAPGTITSTNPCVTDAAGECDVTVSSTSTGSSTVSVVSITDPVATGGVEVPILVTDTTAIVSTDEAVKTWITYDLTVTPEAAVNFVGDPHTFTATLTIDSGNGPVAAPGETLTITGSGTGAITDIVSGTVDTPTSGSCTTSAAGTCQITVNSQTAGSFTVSASFGANVGGTSATFGDSGEKTWVNITANVQASGTNLIGNDHVFTLSAFVGDGEGAAPANGATFSFTWSGTGTANPADTCQAAADSNTCTVTVSSAVPGTGTITIDTVTASYGETTFEDEVPTATAGGSLTATKTWITYRVTVTPETAVNDAGDPHVFTALLERNSGSGFAPVAGEPLAISASGTGSITGIVTGTVASPTSGSCTTSAAGTCQITVNSATAGSLTITATYDATQGSETATYSDSGVKTWVAADLAIVKTASVATADRGGTFNWVLAIANNGPNVAENAVVTDTVPAPFIVTGVTGSAGWSCSRSGNTVACTKPSVAVGETGAITITVSTPVDAAAGTIVNTGSVQATTPDPNLTNNSSSASVVIPAVIVEPPVPPQLPATGSNHVGDIVRAAMALMAVGFVVLMIGRRRSATDSR